MDSQKIKVSEVSFNREYKPQGKQFVIYYFSLKTEDGLEGEFSTNARNQTKFLVGNEYEVDIVEKQNRNGSYNFFDYSEAEKEKHKKMDSSSYSKKGGSYSYVRPRSEVLSIISQSSYEAAAIACKKIAPDTISSHVQISEISNKFFNFITDMSGLNSSECKSDNKIAMKEANAKSIVYQKALKIALECLDITRMETELGEPEKTRTTQGIISLTELIFKDINDIANV